MADFSDLGQALAGNQSGNALSYAKGLSLGANTQSALAEARARVQKSVALDKLGSVMSGFGIHDPAEAAAYSTAAEAGIDPTQFLSARLKQHEAGVRDRIAIAPGAEGAVDDSLAQRLLMSLSNGPVKPFEAVGEGQSQNILHPDQGISTTPLGQSLMAQRNSAAALDDEKRLHPEKFATASPFLVTPGGPLTKGHDAKGNPTLTPTLGADGKPLPYAGSVADVAGAKTGATVTAKNNAENKSALPDALADIDKMNANIDGLISAPGFDKIYGHIAGTELGQKFSSLTSQDAANAMAKRNTLSAEAFGVSIQKMRGLGQLSNAEGLKVTDAFTRASDPKLSPEEAKIAWGEVKQYLSLARSRAMRKAQGDNSAQPAGAEAPGGAPHSFATEAEAEAAGLPAGTRVVIGGVPGTWQ